MSFTDGKPRICTQKDLLTRWGGGRAGDFKCYMCGYQFIEGDYWRWVFTNDIHGASGNPIVCHACDGVDVIERCMEKWKEAKKSFWWFCQDGS